MTDFDIALEHASYVADFSDGTIRSDFFIGMKSGLLAVICPMSERPHHFSATQTIDASSLLFIPGLINCHSHCAMTLFRGLADDLPLMSWLQDHIFPAEALHVDAEMVYWCSKLAAAEMLLSGTTMVADGYFHEEAAVRAFRATGIRAVAAQGVIDFPAPGVPDPAQNIAHARNFIASCRSAAPTVTPGIFCHSPYTCCAATIVAAKQLATDEDVPFFMHVAETRSEVGDCIAKHGLSPVSYLQSLGVLDNQTIVVHGVWLDDNDVALLARSGARLVSCPKSNMKLASGIAPLSRLLDLGIPVGVGTDGVASNNGLDLFSELGCCARLHKVASLDPTVLPALQLLHLATSGGARVLGRADKVGQIRPGWHADLVGIKLGCAHLTPFYHLDSLVYSARGGDVQTVIVEGRMLLKDRTFVAFDLQEVMENVRRLSRRIR